MDLADIAAACGEPRREGRFWRCICRACGGCNLCLFPSRKDGTLRVARYSAGESSTPWAALIARGLIPNGPISSAREPSDAERIARAAKEWARGISPITGSMSERYLRLRAITGPLEWSMLANGWDFYHSEEWPRLQVMLALVEHAGLNQAVAVEITYLDLWRKIRAEPSRRTYGPKNGGGVWFGDRDAVDELIVAKASRPR